MQKIKYVFFHCIPTLTLFLIIVICVTTAVDYVTSQLKSANDGIEILLVDTALNMGDTGELADAVKKKTGVKNVGVATLEKSDAEQYVKTVENYTLTDYLVYLTGSRDAEIIFFTEDTFETVSAMKNLLPDSVRDVTDAYFTEYEAQLTGIGKIYGALLNGDHAAEAEEYLNGLTFKEE